MNMENTEENLNSQSEHESDTQVETIPVVDEVTSIKKDNFLNRSEIKFLSALGFILLGLLISTYILGARVENGDGSVAASVELEESPFPAVVHKAKSVYVYDAHNGKVLYAYNEDARLPLASITKVMAALTAVGIGEFNNTVVINAEALKAMGDSGLYLHERWSLKNLLDFSLITSSNDGMRAVALSLGALARSNPSSDEIMADFVQAMNSKASELELKNTYFLNETGLDESVDKGGAYGSARDVSMLVAHILAAHPELLEATRESSLEISSLSNIQHVARNTNTVVHSIPGLIASKTGYTSIAGGNLVVAFNPELGRPIIITVLGSTEQGRFSDMLTLVNATMEYITQ